jgi:hypothetical protein
MVDLLDNSMAASGTTKKVTVNQILGAGGTATLASATITGDLTVDTSTLKVDSTNNRVGVNTASPAYDLDINGVANFKNAVVHLAGGNPIFARVGAADSFFYAGTTALTIRNNADTQSIFSMTPAGVFTFLDGAGGTRMTLNSTGLGVGVTPSAWNSNYKAIDVGENGTIAGRAGSSNTVDIASNGFRNSGGTWVYKLATSNTACRYQIDGSTGSHIWYTGSAGTAGNTITGFSSALMTLDASGNLIWSPASSPPSLATNGQLTVNATSNTNLRFSYRGSDGTTRIANITLA